MASLRYEVIAYLENAKEYLTASEKATIEETLRLLDKIQVNVYEVWETLPACISDLLTSFNQTHQALQVKATMEHDHFDDTEMILIRLHPCDPEETYTHALFRLTIVDNKIMLNDRLLQTNQKSIEKAVQNRLHSPDTQRIVKNIYQLLTDVSEENDELHKSP